MALKKPSELFNKKEISGVFETPEISSNISESYDKFLNTFEKINQISEKVEDLSQQLSEKLSRTDLENAMLSQLMILDENFKTIQNQVKGLNKKDLKEFKSSLLDLTGIVEDLVQNEIPKYKKQFTKNELFIEDRIDSLKKVVEENILDIREDIESKFDDIVNVVDSNVEYFNQQLHETFSEVNKTKDDYYKGLADVKADVAINEQHIKNIDNYLQEHHKQLVDLKEEVFVEIEKISLGNFQENIERLEKKIDFIKETYSKIEPEIIVEEVLKEGSFAEPPEVKNSDPLTPLNQNFVTLDQLQQHYRLFINRIQQQIATIGGGGETRLKYLDDIVGIATNPSVYDGKFLKYDHSLGNFVFETVSGGGGISLADLSVTVSPSGISTLNYDNSTGVFNYTPPNLIGYATEGYVNQQITNLIDSAPESLDTLNELAAALNDDANFATTITNALSQKANLSGSNFTGVVTAINFNGDLIGTATTSYYLDNQPGSYYLDYNNLTNTPSIPSDTGDLTNSVGFITSGALSGLSTFSGDYNDLINKPFIPSDTGDLTNSVGFITSSALSGYATEGYVTNSLVGYATEGYVNNAISGFSTFSGDYNDLTNTPFIPSDTGDLTNSVGFITSGALSGYATEGYVTNSLVGFITSGALSGYATEGYVTNAISGLSTFSGDYNDLINKPFIPSDTGDLTNSVGFITSGALSGYATEGYVTNSLVGFITSGASGSNLTGIVTYITAGSGISIDQSTGNVTITATGGGGGGGIALTDLSVTISSPGISTLTYNNTSGVFNYTPPDLTGYATTESLVGFITSGALSGYATEGYVTNSLVGYATTESLVGFITSGDSGSNLTGIVTYIEAGSGILVDQNTGKVTITALGGGGGNSVGLTIKDESVTVGTAGSVFSLNFVGNNITATASGTASTITVVPQTYVETSGIATYSDFSGISTYSSTSGIATYSNTAGVSTYSSTSGIATYSNTAGVSTISGYATTSGIATVAQNLTGSPNITVSSVNSSGIVTASSFRGSGSNLTGIVTFITAGSGISVSQNTGNVTITGTGITSGSNNSFTGITTFNGNVFTTAGLQVQQVEETYNSYSTTIASAAVVALDCSTGNTFYITSTVNGNWTANLTNLNLSANCLTNVTLMITQGVTPYVPTALQIGGSAQTINWQGGSVPTGNASKKDAIAFTIFYTGSVYNVFGQLVTFG